MMGLLVDMYLWEWDTYPERREWEPAINRRESSVCVNEGRQLVAGISKPADLFEGRLEERGGVSCKGPK